RGTGIPPRGTHTIADENRTHTIVAVFQQAPGPTPTPTGSGGSGGGNMDNAYRVLFETNGGGFISPVTGLSSGDITPEPPEPVRTGYTFGGWYPDETWTLAWDFTTGIQGDMTLYAKWNAGGLPAETVTKTPAPTPENPTKEPTTIPSVGGTATAPSGGNTDTAPSADTGDDNTSGKYNTGALCFLLLLLFLFLLCLILLLRHTVTFLIPTAEGIERYRIKVWHGKRIDPDNLPELLLTAAWYLDEEREERWDIEEDRVTRSIRLYHG
ncbi:MAG TPA: InlB B-repeat-containing protein, partial [Methanocorpusculum sp.]|nr:InlB B-repeat-containing protein [Methanocorpusculum sp.]